MSPTETQAKVKNLSQDVFDVIVVGAGPCGATAAYFLANGMDDFCGKNVAFLDRATFPRDKFCGDAWCAPALDIMEEMGVLQQLEAEGLIQDCTSGGFVSPSGESYISEEPDEVPDEPSPARCYAIKRMICDEAIVRGAEGVGAKLFENADCESADLGKEQIWTVTCRDGRRFRSKMLIAADGAASNLCRSLGIVHTAPDGTASRQYVKGGTHNFKSGGVLFYPDYAIPGYVAIFRHYDNDIDIGVYLIEGGATPPENILDVAIDGVASDPYMQRLIGPNAVALERPRVASLRTGGEAQSSSTQFMAVGDAAGQTDPLTGEGIHTGMIGAKLAALTIHEMFESGDFSAKACRVYHDRWWSDFGKDFPASAIGAKMTYRMPLILDAANKVAQKKGEAFIEDFGAAMTGAKPKTTFLKPRVSVPITVEIFKQAFVQKVLRPFKSVRAAYDSRAVEADDRRDSFHQSGVIDADLPAQKISLEVGVGDELDKLFRYEYQGSGAKSLYVFYASEYGFSEEVAEELAEHLFEQGKQEGAQALNIRLLSLEHESLVDWANVDSCLFLASTIGDGDPPQVIEAFLEKLKSGLDLSHFNYAVLGFGDSAYPNFCETGKNLDALLKQNQASSMLPFARVNAESRVDIRSWFDDVSANIFDDLYWQDKFGARDDELKDKAEDYFKNLRPPSPGSNIRSPVSLKVRDRKLIGDAGKGGTETFSLTVDSNFGDGSGRLQWQAGDALGVFPENPKPEVEAILNLIPFDSEQPVDLPRDGGRVSFAEAIGFYLDIKDLSEIFYNQIILNLDQGQKGQLDSLRESSSLELQDVFVHFADAMKALGAQDLVDHLSVLQPRYYSIASSSKYDENSIELSIATASHEIAGQKRQGIASYFLNHQVQVGTEVKAFVQANPHFRLPDPGKACVMIGAGTGVAPYRAFMQELVLSSDNSNNFLFFGCKYESADFLYGDEWHDYAKKNSLNLQTAFSRDQEQKIYVQDRLREQASAVWQAISSGAHVYICGDATRMAVDVENTLLEIFVNQGAMDGRAAKIMLDQMSQEKRYQKDVWV